MQKMIGRVVKIVLATTLCVSAGIALAANSSTADDDSANDVPTIDLQHFSSALQAIHQVYVDQVGDDTLFNNAIAGMLSGLDPHSSFLDEDDYKALQDMTNGSFGGIGIEVLPTDGLIQVLTPLDDTPAYNAGIKSGDYIVRINGKSVQGMSLDQAVKEMRGKPGTEVNIVVLRKGESKPLNFTIKREVIKIQSVKSKLLDGDYGYIRIVDFESTTGKDVSDAVSQLQKESKKPLKGIIIDLRNNPGGLLEAAVDVSNVFLDVNKVKYQKKVVYTKGRIPDLNFSAYVTGHDQTHGLPIVVLINGSTASAAEIVAGALQDQDRAVIVGTRSFGKGSVQTLIPLPPDDKTAIKLTTALYYTPSGRSIQAEGIVPDVEVPQLSIPQTVKPAEDVLGTESQLMGHLSNPIAPVQTISVKPVTGSSTSAPNTANKTDAIEQDQALLGKVFKTDDDKSKEQVPLMYRDYQLYEALLILKSLTYSQATGS
jgi:carboxyl-terminal processing protease